MVYPETPKSTPHPLHGCMSPRPEPSSRRKQASKQSKTKQPNLQSQSMHTCIVSASSPVPKTNRPSHLPEKYYEMSMPKKCQSTQVTPTQGTFQRCHRSIHHRGRTEPNSLTEGQGIIELKYAKESQAPSLAIS